MDHAVDIDSSHQEAKKYRAIFISDVHLGQRGVQVEALLEFLKFHDADTIYLVGDIVDGWKLRQMWHWPQSHNDLVQKLLRKGRKGARIIYVPGNHDEFLRDFYGTHFGGIEVLEQTIHTAADGKRYLVTHGDFFDVVVQNARWLAYLGDWAYETTLRFSLRVNWVRRRLGFTYWSFSSWAKVNVKRAVNFIGKFEETLASEARKQGVDGVICGHIHSAAQREIDGIAYINTGDWVESCTALVEHADGRLEIIDWAARSQTLNRQPAPVVSLWRRRAA